MKPVLYPASERQYRHYGLGEIADAYKVEVTRERNGNYSLYMEYPLDGAYAAVFKEEMQLKADAGVRTKWQTFEISRIVKDSKEHIKVYARHVSHRTQDIAILPTVKSSNVNANTALNMWREALVGDDHFDTWSDITTEAKLNWTLDKVANAREALGGVSGSLLDLYGGEYEFDNRTIRLHKQYGRKAPTVLEYGRNILSVEEDIKLESTYTSIYPFVVYTPQSEGGEQLPAEIITLPELVVDGPYLGLYDKRRIKTVDFSGEFNIDKGRPSEDAIRSLAVSYVKNNAIGAPKTELTVSYVDLSQTLDYKDYAIMEEVELCDIIPIYYPKLGITTEHEKVVEVVYNVLTDQNISVKLGTIGQSIKSQLTGGMAERLDTLESKHNQFTESLPGYLMSASGNRIWRDKPDETIEHKIGDTWFEKNGIYNRMYVWNGNMWEKIIDTEDVDRVKKEVSDMAALVDADKKRLAEKETAINEELERFRDQMKNSPAVNMQAVKDEIENLKETNRIQMSLYGNDGQTHYNKNLLDGDTNRNISIDDENLLLVANDGGFKAGVTYTLSFEALCKLAERHKIRFNFTTRDRTVRLRFETSRH